MCALIIKFCENFKQSCLFRIEFWFNATFFFSEFEESNNDDESLGGAGEMICFNFISNALLRNT